MQCPRLGPIYLLYYLRIVVNKPSGSLLSFRTTIKICRFHIFRILVFHAKYNYVGEPWSRGKFNNTSFARKTLKVYNMFRADPK